MKGEKIMPDLRFPGFLESWEEKTLEEVSIWRSGGTPSKKIAEFWEGNTVDQCIFYAF